MTAGLPIDRVLASALALLVCVLWYWIRRDQRAGNFRFIAENSGDVIWLMDVASARFSLFADDQEASHGD